MLWKLFEMLNKIIDKLWEIMGGVIILTIIFN